MWIRSQDKQQLVEAKKYIRVWYNYTSKENRCINVNDEVVGVYGSEERTMEVLNDIQNALKTPEYILNQKIYEMPKE